MKGVESHHFPRRLIDVRSRLVRQATLECVQRLVRGHYDHPGVTAPCCCKMISCSFLAVVQRPSDEGQRGFKVWLPTNVNLPGAKSLTTHWSMLIISIAPLLLFFSTNGFLTAKMPQFQLCGAKQRC